MIDLKSFVGKFVCVQLRDPWIAIGADERGDPIPVMQKDEKKQDVGFAAVPFFRGVVVMEKDTAMVEYDDKRRGTAKMRTAIAPEVIGYVTVVEKFEPPSRIVMPGG